MALQQRSSCAAVTQSRASSPCLLKPMYGARVAFRGTPCSPKSRGSTCRVQASSDNPVRQALSGLASSIYKATASFQEVDSSLPPLWQGLKKLDMNAVQAALRSGADPNETNVQGESCLAEPHCTLYTPQCSSVLVNVCLGKISAVVDWGCWSPQRLAVGSGDHRRTAWHSSGCCEG